MAKLCKHWDKIMDETSKWCIDEYGLLLGMAMESQLFNGFHGLKPLSVQPPQGQAIFLWSSYWNCGDISTRLGDRSDLNCWCYLFQPISSSKWTAKHHNRVNLVELHSRKGPTIPPVHVDIIVVWFPRESWNQQLPHTLAWIHYLPVTCMECVLCRRSLLRRVSVVKTRQKKMLRREIPNTSGKNGTLVGMLWIVLICPWNLTTLVGYVSGQHVGHLMHPLMDIRL